MQIALVGHVDQQGDHRLLLHLAERGELLRIEAPLVLLAEVVQAHQRMHLVDTEHGHVALLLEVIEALEAGLGLRAPLEVAQLQQWIALFPGDRLEVHIEGMVRIVERGLSQTFILLDQGELLLILQEAHADARVVDRIRVEQQLHGHVITGDALGLDAVELAACDDERTFVPVERHEGGFFLGAIALQFGPLHGEASFEVDAFGDVADLHAPIVTLETRIAGVLLLHVGQHLISDLPEQCTLEVRVVELHGIHFETGALHLDLVRLLPFRERGGGLEPCAFPGDLATGSAPQLHRG